MVLCVCNGGVRKGGVVCVEWWFGVFGRVV